jgi:S-methylmethionine-dependent homocysteine/selenocysteine methylase
MPRNPAVFSRNHAEYLSWAAKIAVTDSERLVTFRSSKEWVKAKKLLEHSVDNRLSRSKFWVESCENGTKR